MKTLLLLAAGGLWTSLTGCTAFPVIEANQCGNAVIERPTEACDTFVDSSLKGAVCRPPGVVGECRFDCRPNTDGTRAVCPEGYGCAPDGICLEPTGDFQLPATKFSSEVSSWLSAADFDGDGRQDIISTEPTDQVQRARFRIHYFDEDAELVETRAFPRVTTRPIARRREGAHAADLIFSNDLVAMVPGRADREWVPATFSSYERPGSQLRAVGVRGEGVGNALGLAVFTNLEEGPGVYVQSLDSLKLSRRAKLSRPFEDLAGAPLAAELRAGPGSPCLEVVFAFRGEEAFHVLDLCEVGTDVRQAEVVWRAEAQEQIVRLPRGVKVGSAPLIADIDGDGHLDVLIGDGERTYISRGDGNQLEGEASLFRIPILGEDEPFPLSVPLAAGDLSGDGLADFVLPLGILTSHHSLVDGALGYFVSYSNNARPWSMAVVADLNGNDLLDVIAGAAGAPGLSFLNGTGGPFQVPVPLTTQGPLSFLTTGDFDGDSIGDVAYVQGGPPQDPSDSLAVAFGEHERFPLAGKRIAALRGVQQLGPVRQGPLDSIFVVSTVGSGGSRRSSFTHFDGNPERLPLAPYSLVSFPVDESLDESLAVALTLGAFTARGGSDVMALGAKDSLSDLSLWLVPDIGGGERLPRRLTAEIPAGLVPLTVDEQGGRLSFASVAADLDGDGFDEVLALMPQGRAACSLLIYGIDAAADTAGLRSHLTFDEPCDAPELAAADLDQRGGPDLLLLLGDSRGGPRRLQLLFGDESGGFSLSDRSYVDAPDARDVRAFSVFPKPQISGEPRNRIAFLTERALYVAKTAGDAQKFDDVRELTTFQDARSVVVSDPNGDGLRDIVVADGAGLWLLKPELE